MMAAAGQARGRLGMHGCVWRFGTAAHAALIDELRTRGWPGTAAVLSLHVGGVPVEQDPALAPDAFYLKEPLA